MFRFRIQGAVISRHGGSHLSIKINPGIAVPFLLNLMCNKDTISNCIGGFIIQGMIGIGMIGMRSRTELFLIKREYFNRNINTIQKRPADSAEIFLHIPFRTGAADGVGVISTAAGIHGSNDHGVGRKFITSIKSGNKYLLIFHGLAQNLQ